MDVWRGGVLDSGAQRCGYLACMWHAVLELLNLSCSSSVPSLQIRDLPELLHQLLQRRARAHRRSLAQQALHDLEQLAGGDPRQRRRAALARIAQRWSDQQPLIWPQTPEELIRPDRDRWCS